MTDLDPPSSSSPTPPSPPSDSSIYTWTSFFKILRGQLPPSEQARYRNERDNLREEADCKRCDEWKESLFNTSPTIRFLHDNILLLSPTSPITPSNIRCRRCPSDGHASGGFHPDFGIKICANSLRNKGHLEDTLAHEMVHAYDHLRWRVDWAGKDLRHAACSEIRASSLSGECRWVREFFTRGQWDFTKHHQECVRRRAVLSVQQRPWCKDEAEARRVVDGVWEGCFADTRPFDEIYR